MAGAPSAEIHPVAIDLHHRLNNALLVYLIEKAVEVSMVVVNMVVSVMVLVQVVSGVLLEKVQEEVSLLVSIYQFQPHILGV
jgi:hypothetical protein